MNATKRKFNALLQGIGTRSTGSVSTDKNDPLSRTSSLDLAQGASGAYATSSRSAGPATELTEAPSTTSPLQPAAGTNMLYSSPSRPSAVAATSTTTTTASSAVANLEFLAKRRRIANGISSGGGSTLRDTTGNAMTTPSNVVLRKWGTAGGRGGLVGGAAPKPGQAQTMQQPAPRYCPGDREQLLRRLATFQELTDWTPKPDRINEIEWAKRGWVCQGKERLRCTLCSKELVVRLGSGSDTFGFGGSAENKGGKETPMSVVVPLPSSDDAAETALVDRYADLIVSAHEADCLWQKKGCDDSLLRLPLASPQQAVADLRQRYDELCARKDFLPYEFNLRLPDGLDIDAVLANVPPTFFENSSSVRTEASSSTPHPNRVALALAVMGWQGLTNSRIGAVPNSASCHACLRRLGLWMFKSKQVDLETNTVLEPAPMDYLDAVREHRFFCPWKNGAVQRNPGARTGRSHNTSKDEAEAPGWVVLVQLLKNDSYLRNRMLTSSSKRPLAAGGDTVSVHGSPLNADATGKTANPLEPSTPVRRPATAASATPGLLHGNDDEVLVEEDEAARDARDKERWARLRRVKSLFDTKGTMARKLKRAGVGGGGSTNNSRPGTSQSLRPESQGQGQDKGT